MLASLSSLNRTGLRAGFALLYAVTLAYAQNPAPPQRDASANRTKLQTLRVIVLAGAGETNDMAKGIMAPLVIQVLDGNSRPIEGADVEFHFPSSGPGVTFPSKQAVATAKTNADGQAAASGWKANGRAGSFEIRVMASRGDEFGETALTMTNAEKVVTEVREKRKSWYSSKWFKIGVIAAGATTAAILLTRGGNDDPTITVTPGSPNIGGPQ